MFDVIRLPAFVGAWLYFKCFVTTLIFVRKDSKIDTEFYIFTFNGFK